MRLFIVIAALLLIPAFAVVMEWRFQSSGREAMLEQCRSRLAKAGLGEVSVRLDHFDAVLTGMCSDPADLEKAQALVTNVRGVRLKFDDNQIRVPAKLSANIHGHEMLLSGWLPREGHRLEIVRLAKASRPDLEVSAADIRLSPRVELGPESQTRDGLQPKVFASLLESIRLPASLSITGDGHHYIFKGSLPSPAVRDAIVKAAKESAPGLEIDASQFIGDEHVAAAPFAQGMDLADFVRLYFESPTPGSFQIDQRNGPRIQAYATTAMESAWLAALRPVSGSSRVAMEVTRVPSLFHFPTYQPQSKLEPQVVVGLRETFRLQRVLFDSGSAKIKAEEEAKLSVLAETIKKAGPDLHLIVAGYSDVGGEPVGKTMQHARADVVRSKLVELGVPGDLLEAMPFEAVRPPGPLTDEVRRDTRSVELLIK
ncbi:MAG: sodium-translocating pyrophosphatase [Verrucomicrobiaceae bacterium]|nr:sodium-translocating pyrophosphatase [Verrucomicrobiaceae bacterium]